MPGREQREGPTAGTHVFPALEFLARLLVHVPDIHQRLVREYGAYSTRRRAPWRRAGILTGTRPVAVIHSRAEDATPDWQALRATRQRWAAHLERIFDSRASEASPTARAAGRPEPLSPPSTREP